MKIWRYTVLAGVGYHPCFFTFYLYDPYILIHVLKNLIIMVG